MKSNNMKRVKGQVEKPEQREEPDFGSPQNILFGTTNMSIKCDILFGSFSQSILISFLLSFPSSLLLFIIILDERTTG